MIHKFLRTSFVSGMSLFITMTIAYQFPGWISLSCIIFLPGMVYFFVKLYDKVTK